MHSEGRGPGTLGDVRVSSSETEHSPTRRLTIAAGTPAVVALPRSWLLASLQAPQRQVVIAAAARLGICGRMGDTPMLARLLHHRDSEVVAAAEQALWAIWLRAGDEVSNGTLAKAVQMMNEGRYEAAVGVLDGPLGRSPGFAEVYNQRAIAWYMMDKHLRSVADCRRTLALNPWHFGAAAGLGHSCAQLGFYERALDAYHAALRLHPRMDGIRQAIRQIRELLVRQSCREP